MFLIGNIVACVFWGALIAIVLTAVVCLFCRVLMPGKASNALSLAVLAVFLLFAGFQATLMVGAMYAKGYVGDISDYASALVDEANGQIGSSAQNLDETIHQIEREYPVARVITGRINTDALQEYTDQGLSIADYIADMLRSTLNWYVWRRVLWILGFAVVAMMAIFFFNRPSDYYCDMNNTESMDIY